MLMLGIITLKNQIIRLKNGIITLMLGIITLKNQIIRLMFGMTKPKIEGTRRKVRRREARVEGIGTTANINYISYYASMDSFKSVDFRFVF
jgi:hypothetical protein